MKSNYLMDAEDVANELGISKGHAYKAVSYTHLTLPTIRLV